MISVIELLDSAISARAGFLEESHATAFRLFNGFLEGLPSLCVDIYARTVILHNYAATPANNQTGVAHSWILENLPWIKCIIIKDRSGQTLAQKRGELVYGTSPDQKIIENGIWYAVDLTINRDASFYLDTRNLRAWAQANLAGKTVLNTFAYTGSLAINNALFVSGQEYLASLEALCMDGYLRIEQLIPIPADFTGFEQTRSGSPPSDPAPFNHSTKIAILSVSRKDAKRSE
jgi:hypothetical protein